MTTSVAFLLLLNNAAFTQELLSNEGAADTDPSLYDELKWMRAERVTVSTASLRDETIDHAPATIRVITREQIRERGYRSLYEVLKDLPGVDVLDHVQAESKHRITFRGISGNHKFLILQDGIRINSPTGENIQPIAENYPLYHIKQIEILYGPASAIYGADAFSAVINMITEVPTPEGRVNFSAEVGEYNTRRADIYSAKRFSDSVALSIGGHYQETAAPNLANEYPEDMPFEDLKTFSGTTVIPVEERRDFSTATKSFSTWAKLELGEDVTLGWNQSLFRSRVSESTMPLFTDYDEFADTLLLTTYGKYRYELSDRINGNVNASYSRYEQLPESRFQNQVTEFTDGYFYALGERFAIEPQINYEMDDHILSLGLTLEYFHSIPHTTDFEKKYDRGKDPEDQNLYHIGTNGTLPIDIYELYYYNIGGFIQEQAQWSEEFSTTLGLRFDHNEDYGETWNPRLGMVYQPSPRTSWKALYGQAFLAPSPFERYENFGVFAFPRPDGLYQSFFFHVPNPDLEPEELQSFEISVSHQFGEDLDVSLAGYYNTIDNVILNFQTPTPETDFVPGGSIDFTEASQNIGESESYGFELTADQTFQFDITRLNLWASFSYIDGELKNKVTDFEMNLPFTSKELVKLGLTCNMANRVIITPMLRWNGEQNGFPFAEGEEIQTSDFTVVDLYAEVRNRRQSLAVFLRVNNLLDERYYNAGRTLSFLFNESPQDPRWVTTGLRVSY